MSEEWLREKLAEIEHERWADWQKWCHKILRENSPSSKLEAVLERWDKQIAKSYKDLSESEKQSDRDQVGRYWPLIIEYSAAQRQVDKAAYRAELLEKLGDVCTEERFGNNLAWNQIIHWDDAEAAIREVLADE